MNTYDKVADSVRDYIKIQMENDRCIDRFYIVHFYQKYEWENKWDECTEIVEVDDDLYTITFQMDFCEGQTDIRDVLVLSLWEVGDIMKRVVDLIKHKK